MAVTAPSAMAARASSRAHRVFIGGRDEPRARRATDGLLLSASAVGLVLVSVAAFPEPRLASLADTFLTAWPDVLDGLWQAAGRSARAAGAGVGGGGGAHPASSRSPATCSSRPAWRLRVGSVVSRLTHDTWPDLSHLDQVGPPPLYPAARLAFPAAVVLAASPHLTVPARRVCRWVVGLAAPGAAVLGATTSLGVVAGLLVAVAAAAAVHLAFGSSAGRPALEHVRQGLEEIGVATVRLDAADRQEAGLFVVEAEGASGESLVVKVYGRDARDTAFIATLWRTVWFREPGSPARLGRLDQVEHEALLTLLAAQAGVRTDEVVTAGATDDGNALLVLKRDGALLDDVPEAHLDDEQIHALWDSVGRMHDARIAHGRLDARSLIAADGSVIVVGFRGATVAASEAQLRTDDAQALVTTALLADEEHAVAIARERLGEDGLGATLPYVQPPALTATQRRNLRKQGIDLDVLRTAAAGAAGVEAPALLQLRRFSVGSIVRVLLPALALIVLISAAGGIEWDEVKDSLASASWWLVAIGVVFAQTPRFTQSLSTLGASPIPIPLGPLYALQLAVSYVNLAIPSSAAASRSTSASSSATASRPGPPWPPGRWTASPGSSCRRRCSWVCCCSPPSRSTSSSTTRRAAGCQGSSGWSWWWYSSAPGCSWSCPSCGGSSPPGRGASGARPSKRCAGFGPTPRPPLRRQPGHRDPLRVVVGHLRSSPRLLHRDRRAPADQHQRGPARPGCSRCRAGSASPRVGSCSASRRPACPRRARSQP